MNAFLKEDWRKQASMTATNDLDVEKAFSDMASGFVENKLGDLMKDEYRIGFEIVKKNDDNTKMVGIFAFKVDKELFFAPVFFLNGEIKGPLLYRCDTKTFIPATKDWAAYLIAAGDTKDGVGRDRSALSESAPLVQMQKLTFKPNSMNKSSAAEEKCCCKCCGEKECKCTTIKPGIKAPDITGVYPVEKDFNTKPGQQPKLSTGDSVLKMASSEVDGMIHLLLGDVEGVLSKKDADAIKQASYGPITITVADDTTFTLYPNNLELVKKAFFENVQNNAAEWADNMFDIIEKQAAEKPLAEFLRERDFGKVASEAILKVASSDKKFARLLVERYSNPEDLIPVQFEETVVKSASNEGTLSICYNLNTIEKSAAASKRFFEEGFYVKDTRPMESLSVVVEDSPDTISAVGESGTYSLLRDDGTFEDNVFVAPYSDVVINDQRHDDSYESDRVLSSVKYTKRTITPAFVAIKDGKVLCSKNLVGIPTGASKKSPVLKDKPEEHKTYLIYLDGKVFGPVAANKVNTVDGVSYCEISRDSYPSRKLDTRVWVRPTTHETVKVTINPDLARSEFKQGILGRDAKFIELNAERGSHPDSVSNYDLWKDGGTLYLKQLEGLGSSRTVDNWIYKKFDAPKVTLMSKFKGNIKEAAYKFDNGETVSAPMNRVVALVKLARDMEIPAEKAYEIIDAADKNKQTSFYLSMQKTASRLRLAEQPIFDEDFDSEFGIPVKPTQEFHLKVHGDQIFERPSARGDMLNPTSVTGLPNLTVVTTAPEDLRSLADTYNLANVFEHAAVGTLANTFNALSLIDKYIPKIEECVDALGRIKFLMFWRPSDFEQAYGEDDMNNMEAEVDSNFESIGALLLKLLKKADKQKKKQVDFSSDAQQ